MCFFLHELLYLFPANCKNSIEFVMDSRCQKLLLISYDLNFKRLLIDYLMKFLSGLIKHSLILYSIKQV